MKQKGLTYSAVLLTLSAVMAKVFSAIYRIFLTRILGGVGIGLYQLIFPVYSMCVVLSTTGIPLAVSKVVARYENSKEVVKFCFKFVMVISITLCILLFSFSGIIAKTQGNVRIVICFKLLAPSLIIIGISSVLKGYFQGKMNYIPSAVSQVVEQFVKMVFGLAFAYIFIQIDLIYSIVGAVAAIVLSEVVSLLILFLSLKESSNVLVVRSVNKKQIIKDILPITITNLILPAASFVDSLIVVKLLSANFTREMSIYLYGLESGAVYNIATLPTMFSFAMATVIMPSFSSNNKGKERFSKLFQLVFLITIPCVIIFVVSPQGIMKILYSNRLQYDDFNGIAISSNLLKISGIGTLFLALSQILSSYLQSQDRRVKTIRNLLIGVVIKFVVEIIFLANIEVHIYALAIANTLCYFTVFILHFLEVKKFQNMCIEKYFYSKIFASIFLMLLVLFSIRLLGDGVLVQLISYLFAGVFYLLGIFLLNAIDFKKLKKQTKNREKV